MLLLEKQQSLKILIQKLSGMLGEIDDGKGTLGALLSDSVNFKQAVMDLKTASADLKEVARQLNGKEGTLGKLINDDSLIKETEKTMKKVQKAAEGIQEQTPITVLGTIIGLFF